MAGRNLLIAPSLAIKSRDKAPRQPRHSILKSESIVITSQF
jgi:hypothetical protein